MLHEIIPHVSCFVDPAGFEEAKSAGYAEIYLPHKGGKFLKHVKLSGNRHVRLEVDSLPKSALEMLAKEVTIEEEINFLPAGKIPKVMFDQIVEFFRKVIELKKAQFEAHAWILWSQERGYFISIPPQTVGGASVKFEYNDDCLPKGSVIVVDLH